MQRPESSQASTSSRPLTLRIRPDLQCNRQWFQGREYWVIKDPLSLKYYRFELEEFALLNMLDGRRSADEIQTAFNHQFAPQNIAIGELFQFVGMLYRNALLVSDNPDQGVELLARARQNAWRQRGANLLNVLAIQFRGFDPDRVLSWANARFGWLFSRAALVAVMLFGLSALMLIVTHWEEFRNRLPHFREFFAAQNWLWLAATLAATKVIHEFGHGVACKRFGGHAHEMGVMFLVLTPCLYCNVSDAWMLPNKWHRMAIGAAGMYVEWIMASACAFLWWYSNDGLINQLALNVVFVCSVSTLLFNANPLMKYDGYYILCDALEIPNLRQKSGTLLRQAFNGWLLGIPRQPDPFLPIRHRGLFAGYSVAAAVYRWVITFSILLFLYRVLEPYGFKVIGQIIAIVAVAGLFVSPAVGVYKFFSVPGRSAMIKRSRAMLTAIVVVAILIGALTIPLPHYVRCPLYVEAHGGQKVYIERSGRIVEVFVEFNQPVNAGQPIARLADAAVAGDLAELQGEWQVAGARLASVRRLASEDQHRFAGDAAAAESRLVAYSRLIEQKKLDADQLVVRAPADGILLAPDWVDAPADDDGTLSTWHGHVLDRANLGALAIAGTLVGQVVPIDATTEAVLAIDQRDIEFISPGQPVEIWLALHPAQTLHAVVDQVSQVQMKDVPKGLSSRHGGGLQTVPGPNGIDLPRSTTYRLAVPLPRSVNQIDPGASGVARIRVGSQTIGARIWRFVCQTFRFEL